MNAHNDNTAAKGLRGWWLSPPRPGMQRIICPWDTAASVRSGSGVWAGAGRGRRGRRVFLVWRRRMGSLLSGHWGVESRGRLLVHHHRSLRTGPG